MNKELTSTYIELYPLVAAIVSMFTAQTIKIIHAYITKTNLDVRKLFTSGGMPSSHSAMVTSLSTAVGLKEGWTSTMFSISVVFALIVIYDAAGVRRAVGRQAALLNQMIEDAVEKGEFATDKMSELLGHTPFEVLVGILLGIGISFSLFY